MDIGTADGKATEVTLVVLDGYEIREQLKASGYHYDEPAKSWLRVVPAADGKAARSALMALGVQVANGSTYAANGIGSMHMALR